jgi:hypothetical protein
MGPSGTGGSLVTAGGSASLEVEVEVLVVVEDSGTGSGALEESGGGGVSGVGSWGLGLAAVSPIRATRAMASFILAVNLIVSVCRLDQMEM